jgi:probable rRNA maturation factor
VKVLWSDAGSVPVPKPKELAALATSVLRAEGLDGRVNLVFCEDALVRKLNRQFRKLDKVTDVLSFHYGEDEDDPEAVWGEIYIATTQALKQAPRWKNPFFDELRRLVVHGALHLAGYDHMKATERLTMRAREDHYLTHGK